MKNFFILKIALFIFIVSCKTNEGSQTETPKNNLREHYVSLTRGSCLGQCPSYNIIINGDGTFTYFGKTAVSKLGAYKGKLEESQVNAIFELLNTFDWDDYLDEYPIDNFDFPQFIFEFHGNKKEKVIKGNSNTPKELLLFNNSLDVLIKNIPMQKLN